MSAQTIEKGSKVKVEFEGEVSYVTPYEVTVKAPDGTQLYLPKDGTGAKVVVTEKPLPPEPPAGSIVTDETGCCMWKSFYGGSWYRLQDNSVAHPAGPKLTWRQVVKKIREWSDIRYLVEDPAKNAVSLKKEALRVKDPNKDRTYEVAYKPLLGGRIIVQEASNGAEVFRLDPAGALSLAKAIHATLGS